MDKAKDFEKGWEEYKAKKKQEIEEMARTTCNYNAKNFESCVECIKGGLLSCDRLVQAEKLYNAGYRKIPENAVVITREEYDELVNLQQTHSEELTNAIQSYEEDKADLKINYDNHIKNLEKIIDRQSKDLNSQANRLIDLKAKLENSRKETAEKFAEKLKVEFDEILLSDTPLSKIDEICKEITEGVKGVSR